MLSGRTRSRKVIMVKVVKLLLGRGVNSKMICFSFDKAEIKYRQPHTKATGIVTINKHKLGIKLNCLFSKMIVIRFMPSSSYIFLW